MATSPRFVHIIDEQDRIIACNEPWLEFGRENAYGHPREFFLSRPLWDFISDDETRYLYRELLRKVRRSACPIALPYRCDSPECRRFMEMRIEPARETGEIRFESRLLRQERRPAVAALEPTVERDDAALMRICGWCKLVDCGKGRWLEIEEAIPDLGLFALAPPPAISHGICPDCASGLRAQIHR